MDKKYTKGKRGAIGKVLIEELEKWESTTRVQPPEFCLLVERLYKLIK